MEKVTKSVEFIVCEDDGRFSVREDALALLEAIQGDVAVIALAGLQRTGKSFLMNLLSREHVQDGSDRTFVVGNTVNTCTKGINMFLRREKDVTVVFLDTEGFGSTIRSQAYDIKLFSLALLLSSMFVYNSRGVIDGNAIEDLSLVVELTKHIHVMSKGDSEDSGEQFGDFFPSFLWLLRDFTLKLRDKGKKITPKQYLENSLKQEGGFEENAMRQDQIRAMIKGFFPRRDCVTLVRPMLDESKLQTLTEQPYESLRADFRSGVEALRERFFQRMEVKTMYGKNLLGKNLATLARVYVDSMNEGNTPTIATAWTRVVEAQAEEAVEKAIAEYDRLMQRHVAPEGAVVETKTTSTTKKLRGRAKREAAKRAEEEAARAQAGPKPFELEDLRQFHDEALESAHKLFRTQCMDAQDSSGYLDKISHEAGRKFEKIRKDNDAACRQFCKARLDKLAAELIIPPALPEVGPDGELSIDGTEVQHAVRAFSQQVAQTIREYHKEAIGPVKNDVAVTFLSDSVFGTLTNYTDEFGALLAESLVALRKNIKIQSKDNEQLKESLEAAQNSHALEKEALKKRLEQAAADAEKQRGQLQEMLDTKATELKRMWEQHDRSQQKLADMQSEIDKQRRLGEAEQDKLRSRIADVKAELATLQQSHNSKLVEIEKAHGKEKETLLRQQLEMQSKCSEIERQLKTQSEDHARQMQMREQELQQEIKVEKQRADNAQQELQASAARSGLTEKEVAELKDAKEHNALLKDHLQVTKDLLKSKDQQVVEVEYQWASTKARLAQAESEKEELDADVEMLEDILSRLKRFAIQNKGDLRALRLKKDAMKRLNEL